MCPFRQCVVVVVVVMMMMMAVMVTFVLLKVLSKKRPTLMVKDAATFIHNVTGDT